MGEIEEYSDPHKIMLDFDQRRTPRLSSTFTGIRLLGLRVRSIRDDRTVKGWHRVISVLEALSPLELVAIQATLGSDRRRENLNLLRIMRTRATGFSPFQERRWNILYRTKLE